MKSPSADKKVPTRGSTGSLCAPPTAGYLAIDGETAMWILNSPSIAADCVYIGMLQWYPPGG